MTILSKTDFEQLLLVLFLVHVICISGRVSKLVYDIKGIIERGLLLALGLRPSSFVDCNITARLEFRRPRQRLLLYSLYLFIKAERASGII